MRADISTLVALYTGILVPGRNGYRYAALLVSGSAVLERAVNMLARESGYRQGVAVHTADRLHNFLDHLDDFRTALQIAVVFLIGSVCPGSRDLNLVERGSADVDRLVVHIDDILALLQVGLGRSILHIADRFFLRHDLCQREERRLEDGVGALAHTDLDRLVDRVDRVELDVVLRDIALRLSRHVVVELFIRPLAVDHEDTARLDVANHREALDNIGGVMAGNEVRLVDIVRRLDRLVAKTQVRNGYAAGLLGVVLEVRLNILVGMVADDLDGVLVRADRAVAAKAPELALDGAFCRSVRRGLLLEGQVGDVVGDADGELALGLVVGQLLVYCKDRGRGRILGTQAVTAADHGSVGDAGVGKSGDNIQVERLALGARLLGAVEDSDLLRGLRDRGDQLVRTPRTVQANLDQADLFAVRVEVIDNFLCYVADRAHRDDHAVSIRRAVVVEQLVVGAELGVNLAHVLLNDFRNRFVILVARLAVLEEYVAVLVRAAHHCMLRIEGTLTERFNSVHVAHFLQVLVVPNLDLLDLVGGAEAVEEVDERNAGLDGRQMRNRTQVHNFLRVGLSQHGETGLAAGHNVGMVAEDVQRMGCNRTRGNMEHAGKQLTSDLVHVRDHQQQALRSRVGGGQRAGCQRAVHRTRGARLGLHFDDLYGRTENVLLTCGCPLVNAVCHGAGRGDRIDTRDLGKRIRHMCRSGVTVHGLHLSCHVYILLFSYNMLKG